jgi:hypothetical protein
LVLEAISLLSEVVGCCTHTGTRASVRSTWAALKSKYLYANMLASQQPPSCVPESIRSMSESPTFASRPCAVL